MKNLSQYLNNLPSDLVNALQTEFQKLHREYFLGRWEPSQLDGGRFAEIVFRILEYKLSGTYTQIGDQLNRLVVVSSISQSTTLDDSLRFHMLKIAELILDFRNKRNVAHPGTIDANEMDSGFVIAAANWIFAEMIRLENQMSPADAQAEIQRIIERKVPIIEEIGGKLKILNSSIGIREKILVLCYQKFPQEIPDKDLLEWTEYDIRHKDRFRFYLIELSKDSRIDYNKNQVVITRKGILWVEKNIKFELEA